MKYNYKVIDSAYNRAWYKNIIGKTFTYQPGYAQTAIAENTNQIRKCDYCNGKLVKHNLGYYYCPICKECKQSANVVRIRIKEKAA